MSPLETQSISKQGANDVLTVDMVVVNWARLLMVLVISVANTKTALSNCKTQNRLVIKNKLLLNEFFIF